MKLDKVREDLKKRFKIEDILYLHSENPIKPNEILSTGVPSLDEMLGIGGLPLGRFVEFYGPEGCGKTTLALHVIAEAQKRGLQTAFIDLECSLDVENATNIGVDLDNVLMSHPDSAETCMDVVEALAGSGEVSVIVIDSLPYLTPRAELEGEYGDAIIGVLQKILAQACKKIVPLAFNNNCLIIWINQMRANIGAFGYGSPEMTPGGKAIKHAYSVRLDLRRVAAIKDSEKVIGSKTKIKTTKNKLHPPHQEVEVELIFGEGFSTTSSLLDVAIEKGVIEKSGAWFSFEGTKFAQGRDKARKALAEPELRERIQAALAEEKI